MKSSNPRTFEAPQFQLCLRVKHPTLDPKTVTNALSLEPEHAVKAGMAVSETGMRQLHSESYWLGLLPTATGSEMLERARDYKQSLSQTAQPLAKRDALGLSLQTGFYDLFIVNWLNKLAVHRELFQKINQEQGTVTMLVQRPDHTNPFTVSPALARRLVDLGIALEID